MKPKDNRSPSKTPADVWYEFIQKELKQNSKVGKAFEKAVFAGFENKTLSLYFEDDSAAKVAKGQIVPLKQKLPPELRPCDRIDCKVGKSTNPLQSLNFADLGDDSKGNELSHVLSKAVEAEKRAVEAEKEKSRGSVYTKLCQRTELLAGGTENTLRVSFSWRLRVGGTRGFRELLLPVFHPVFGVPYIPASSLKGAARAWARRNGESKNEISKILGILEGKTAQAAKVEFLDAFPTKKCLSVDVATPQWHWQNHDVKYKPEPHLLLSMERPEFLIGLCPTKPENAKYIPVVKKWLENALKSGIGSRVSSGYGRALEQIATLPHSRSYSFELWTQGMYGSEPPSKQNHWQGEAEFRPTAIRGILRYWFRAVALSLYEPLVCRDLEDRVFGKLSQQGQVSVSTVHNPSKRDEPPYLYNGKIYLEATEQKYLDLLEKLLILASHLGGVGRGSRRPLHSLDINGNEHVRGCHWTVDANDTPLAYDLMPWQQLFKQIKDTFERIQSPITSRNSSPESSRGRQQDVLDVNAQVWLVKSPSQTPPDEVSNWHKEGLQESVRGKALSLFYSDHRFKGKNKTGQGNSEVGGKLETPSFVWIKSVFPKVGYPYQIVTIFGIDQPDRLAFAKELDELAKSSEAILVFGTMPNKNSQRSNHPTRRK